MQSAADAETAALQQALAAARRDEPGSEALLKGFIETYPSSLHAAEARLELATLHLLHGETATALDEFEQMDARELPADMQHLLFFRKGQALLESGRYAEARPYYTALAQSGDDDYQTEVSYYLAYLDYQQGNYDEALTRFAALPFSEKYAATTPYYITQILFRQGKWTDAERQAQRLLGAGQCTTEQHAELSRIAGECLLQQGETAAAMPHLATYLSETAAEGVQPIASSAYNYGVLAAAAGNNTAAVEALSRAASAGQTTDPATACRAYLLLGQTYLDMGQELNARMAFERAAKQGGDSAAQEAAAYNYAVMVHQSQCSPFDEEITVFEDFLNTYPQSQYADKAGEYLTEIYLTTRNYEAALASMDRIKQPTASLRVARQRLLYQLGVQRYVNGSLADARQTFTDAIALGSLHAESFAESHFWRGECYYAEGAYAKAEADYRKFNTLKPSVEASHLAAGQYNLGYALFKQAKYKNAITPFADYTSRPSERGTATYADAMTRLGDCYYYTRNFSRAEEYYAAATGCAEATAADYALFQQAFMAGLQKKYTTKLQGLEQLVNRYPQSEWVDDALLERGKTYLLQGDKEEAIKAFREVVTGYATKPCAPEAGLQLALVYYNSGRTADAIKAYKEVVANYPGSSEALTALEDLKNIYVEQGQVSDYAAYVATLDGKVQLSAAEQDSLTYVSATRLVAQGKTAEALATYRELATRTDDARYRRRAWEGSLRTAATLGNDAQVVSSATELCADATLPTALRQEALLMRAKAYLNQGNTTEAASDLQTAAADMRSVYGAEAKYLLAQLYFDHKQIDDAETVVMELINSGTPHQHWLARGFILLADVSLSRGDNFQAQQYLLSLQSNYTGDAEIDALIADRLAKCN
jgi:TolA-binding protein